MDAGEGMKNLSQLFGEIDALRDRLATLRCKDTSSLLHALDIEYTFESNRIEGNTLTLRETALIIDRGLTVGGKSMREHLEVLNHYEAVVWLRELVREQTPMSETLIKQLHGLVLRGIDRENAGRYRSIPVMIAGSRHLPPQPWQVPMLMEDCLRGYEEERATLHAVEVAARMHERIATVHPFVDGNGRTARLVMNCLLLQQGYPVANVGGDTETRLAYYQSLETANIDGDINPFLRFIAHIVLASAQRLCRLAGEGEQAEESSGKPTG